MNNKDMSSEHENRSLFSLEYPSFSIVSVNLSSECYVPFSFQFEIFMKVKRWSNFKISSQKKYKEISIIFFSFTSIFITSMWKSILSLSLSLQFIHEIFENFSINKIKEKEKRVPVCSISHSKHQEKNWAHLTKLKYYALRG